MFGLAINNYPSAAANGCTARDELGDHSERGSDTAVARWHFFRLQVPGSDGQARMLELPIRWCPPLHCGSGYDAFSTLPVIVK
jgi:hypothetical protein